MADGYTADQITIRAIDVTAQARALYGEETAEYIAGHPLPPADPRIEVIAQRHGHRSEATFHAGAVMTLQQILDYMNGGK